MKYIMIPHSNMSSIVGIYIFTTNKYSKAVFKYMNIDMSPAYDKIEYSNNQIKAVKKLE